MIFEIASTNKSDLVVTPKASSQKEPGAQQ
jgi:hypothetical protein